MRDNKRWMLKAHIVLSIFKKSSPKPLGQMNRNLAGSIYGRFSIKIAHFVLIHKQTWLPQAILEEKLL
jgi:hypothetical protein